MKHRLLIQLSSAEHKVQRSLIGQINNLLKFFNYADVQVRVVCHGESLEMVLKESNFADDIKMLGNHDVVFAVCKTMVIANNKTKENILESVEIIPSGIAEILLKQEEGWSYMKAGF